MKFFKDIKKNFDFLYNRLTRPMIHPKIKKFWTKMGYIIIPINYQLNSSYYMLFAYNSEKEEQIKIYLRLGDEENYYLDKGIFVIFAFRPGSKTMKTVWVKYYTGKIEYIIKDFNNPYSEKEMLKVIKLKAFL